MTPEVQIVLQAIIAGAGGVFAMTARSALTELRAIARTVEVHGQSLAAGNEKFRGINRELEALRRDVDRLKERAPTGAHHVVDPSDVR